MSKQTIILVRHAKAENSSGQTDRERRLTAGGRKQAKQLGELLAPYLQDVGAVLVSPATRAQETWQGLSSAIEVPLPEPITVEEIYSGDASEIVGAVGQMGSGAVTVVVGHEPTISGTGQVLAKADQDSPWGVPTGTAIIFESEDPWEEWRGGHCNLEEVVLTR